MANNRSSLDDIERRRTELEQNVAKLQSSLRLWQAWEIEYEGMKDEISELGDHPTPAEIIETADGIHAALVGSDKSQLTRDERLMMLRTDKGAVRSTRQILNLISNRIDYVQQNIKTARSLLNAAENKLVAADVLREAKVPNDDGLPLTDIHEELDDDDNIIASSTSVPGESAATAVNAIEKATGKLETESDVVKPAAASASLDAEATPIYPTSKGMNIIAEFSKKQPESPKKRVSFADDLEDIPQESVPPDHKRLERSLLKEISDRQADELERREMAESVIPEGESLEDAALRRQMIQYNMDEVGAVVAEIDLEDGVNSESEYDSEIQQEDDEIYRVTDDDEAEEEEDEFGRVSRSKPLDETFVKRMQALSAKLKADAMMNVGPSYITETGDRRVDPKSKINRTNTNNGSIKKKGVRFAQDLDIQEAPEVSVANLLAASSTMTGKAILQPPGLAKMNSTEAPMEDTLSGSRDVSKFKGANDRVSVNASIAETFNSTPHTVRLPKPASQILADDLVERPFTGSKSASPAPDENNEIDPGLLQNQISTEYHRLRNRQIQLEGGFLGKEEERAEIQLVDEKNEPKKISRFRAARLGLQ